MNEEMITSIIKKYQRYQLHNSVRLLQKILIKKKVENDTLLITSIWDEIEVIAKNNPFLYKTFKKTNTIIFCGLVSTILKNMSTQLLEKIDTRFSDPQNAFEGYASANEVLGNIQKNALDTLTQIEMLGMVLVRLKESHEKEIKDLLKRYNGNKDVDKYFLYPDYPIDNVNILYIEGEPTRISIRRMRNGIGHGKIKIDEKYVKIWDVNPRNPMDKYKIKTTHEVFKNIVFYYYFEIGMILAINDLINLICFFDFHFGKSITALLQHLRLKGYKVPKYEWDDDEIQS